MESGFSLKIKSGKVTGEEGKREVERKGRGWGRKGRKGLLRINTLKPTEYPSNVCIHNANDIVPHILKVAHFQK